MTTANTEIARLIELLNAVDGLRAYGNDAADGYGLVKTVNGRLVEFVSADVGFASAADLVGQGRVHVAAYWATGREGYTVQAFEDAAAARDAVAGLWQRRGEIALREVVRMAERSKPTGDPRCRNGRLGVPGECPADCAGYVHRFDEAAFIAGAEDRGIHIDRGDGSLAEPKPTPQIQNQQGPVDNPNPRVDLLTLSFGGELDPPAELADRINQARRSGGGALVWFTEAGHVEQVDAPVDVSGLPTGRIFDTTAVRAITAAQPGDVIALRIAPDGKRIEPAPHPADVAALARTWCWEGAYDSARRVMVKAALESGAYGIADAEDAALCRRIADGAVTTHWVTEPLAAGEYPRAIAAAVEEARRARAYLRDLQSGDPVPAVHWPEYLGKLAGEIVDARIAGLE